MNFWKGTFAATAAFGLVAGASSTAFGAAACGDLNSNGSFTAVDCGALLTVVAAPPGSGALCGGSGATQCGDLNDDGSVSIGDVVVCVNVAAGNVPLFAPCTGPDPGRCTTPGSTIVVNTNVTSNQYWNAGCTYELDGTIFVTAGNTLKIDAGVTVKGREVSGNGSPSALVFLRNARIDANGSAASPIIFTSDQPIGTRGKGDWGGVVFNGNAPVNTPGGEALSEGLNNIPFGGNVANDNSGVARFVRVEYAGRALTADNELNLWTMNSVGSATQFDHIQAHYGLDDCHEWFGGNVNGKFLVASACGDDGLDWQLGWTGKVQHSLVAQSECAVESGSHGIEADNNENGFNNLPRSAPIMCNVTQIGTRGQNLSLNSVACSDPASEIGMHLRRGTAGRMYNFITENFGSRGLRLEHVETAATACNAGPTLTGNLTVANSIYFNNGATGLCDSDSFYGQLVATQNTVPADGSVGTDPGVATAWPPTDPRPSIGSLADTHPAQDCSAIDAFFDNAGYVGGFEPGGSNWLTTPWVSFLIDGQS
jgi:hypothetical protein